MVRWQVNGDLPKSTAAIITTPWQTQSCHGPPTTAALASVQGKAAHCCRDSIDCSFSSDIVFCSCSQQPVDEGNGATEHLEVASIRGYCVSAPATGSNTTNNHTSSLLGSCHEGLHVNLSPPNFIAAFHIPNHISLDSRGQICSLWRVVSTRTAFSAFEFVTFAK